MIFLGDLACPPEKVKEFNKAVEELEILDNETVIINLEAVISGQGKEKPETLYNSPDVLNAIKRKAKRVIVSLANNHMYDYPDKILSTKEYLEKNGIGVFGLQTKEGLIKPYEWKEGGRACAVFGHCWNLYSATNPNKENSVRIVDNEYDDFLRIVKEYIKSHPDTDVYCFMHWNYDLEKYPFPMHVKLSHDLIDSGVKGVLGSHSHLVQGVEKYKGCPIAYGLGNFYLPSGIYFNGTLTYPEISRETIGLKIGWHGDAEILTFKTDSEQAIKHLQTDSLNDYDILKYSDDLRNYTRYFRAHRVKKVLVPVFTSYSGHSYKVKKQFAIARIKGIKTILKFLRK